MKYLIVLATVLATSLSWGDLIAHYDFESIDISGAQPISAEVTSTGADYATTGSRATFVTDCRRLGTNSLKVVNRSGPESLGADGTYSSNAFDWSASDVRTIAFWVKAAVKQTDPQPTLISLGNSASNGTRFDIRLDSGRLRLELQGNGFTTSNFLNDNTWHHVAVVVQNSTSTLADVTYYVDGSNIGNMSGTAPINTNTSPLRMGDSIHDANRDFTGNLDDVRVYDHALDDDAILELFQDAVMNIPAILCFESSSLNILADQSITLSWEFDPSATAAQIDHKIGDLLPRSTDGAGSTNLAPTETTTYTMTIIRGIENVQQQITVNVTPHEPVKLTAVSFANTGVFQVTARNMIRGNSYRLDSASDLETLFSAPTLVTRFTAASSVRTLLDPTGSMERRFYRLVDES